MVEPFYAMKCNPDPVIVRLLATLGCGFDCATMGEINLVLNDLGSDLSFKPKNFKKTSIKNLIGLNSFRPAIIIFFLWSISKVYYIFGESFTWSPYKSKAY